MKITASLFRFALTAAIVVLALVLGHALWSHYLYAPWTRDGRVRADVVRVAPDVSGLVSAVRVGDNQFVHRGDVLFVVDQEGGGACHTGQRSCFYRSFGSGPLASLDR